MKHHFSRCGKNQPASIVQNIMADTAKNELIAQKRLNGMEYISEESVCLREIFVTRKTNFTEGFKQIYVGTLGGPERLFQCRACNKTMKSTNVRDRHR